MEIELKLALPCAEPAGLVQRLGRTPPLAKRKPQTVQLRNIYYDTPDQRLRQQRIALRIRKVEGISGSQWLQTLKTAGNSTSALSQRGEWETPVPDDKLARTALEATPWPALDPDGTLFAALQPCFATHFERTLWTVRQRDGSAIEVALDLGTTFSNGKEAPICELELELLAGPPQALFNLARQIARTVAVLPSQTSKAARGYLLAKDGLHAPLRGKPPALSLKATVPEAARQLLREMLGQLTGNLNALCSADDPEITHQARIAWRRFSSFWRLCRKHIPADSAPPWAPLAPLMSILGRLRDLDVARNISLPPLQAQFIEGQSRRAPRWHAHMDALEQAAMAQRQAARQQLHDPRVGACLLAMTEWLESPWEERGQLPSTDLSAWASGRMQRLHDKIERAQQSPRTLDGQHRLRILSKRLRYGVEALCSVLPPKRAQQWHAQALQLQSSLGATRDMAQAVVLAEQLQADPVLQAFLHGVAVGQASPPVI
jgi:inorganic triphosphatase YgiF